MNRLPAVLLALLFTLACASLHAQDHLNNARGFNPKSPFEVGSFDNINLFNGNLVIPIPIGQKYSVGGNLAYQFMLVYNGQFWTYRGDFDVRYAFPQRQYNVGLGWHFSLGELYAPAYKSWPLMDVEPYWAYMSPDGARTVFYPVLHKDEETNPDYDAGHDTAGVIGYTRDGTYTRLVRLPNATGPELDGECVVYRYAVEKADGTVHTFRSACGSNDADSTGDVLPYFLETIADRFGNALTVAYTTSTGSPAPPQWAQRWKITDNANRGAGSQRTHEVHLQYAPFGRYRGANADESRMIVTKVDLAAFPRPKPGSPGETTDRAVWEFANYDSAAAQPDSYYRPLLDPCPSGDLSSTQPRVTKARFLDRVVRPDGSRYEMTYFYGVDKVGLKCHDGSGHLAVLELPTGGKVTYWTGTRLFPHYIPPEWKPDFMTIQRFLGGIPNSGGVTAMPFSGFLVDGVWMEAYVYGPSGLPEPDPPELEYRMPFYTSVAVGERIFHRDDGRQEAKIYWTCLRNNSPVVNEADRPKKRELVIAVDERDLTAGETSPTRRTLHYFTVDILGKEGWKPEEYGLPFTRAADAAQPPEEFRGRYFLSTEVLDRALPRPRQGLCEIEFDHPDRVAARTFVRYEYDEPVAGGGESPTGLDIQTDTNRRMTGKLTIRRTLQGNKWVDDTSCPTATADTGAVCYTLEEYSDFDGLGHFRNVTRSTNIGSVPSRTTRTAYKRPSKPAHTYVPGGTNDPSRYMIGASEPWIVSLYDETSVKEGALDAVTSQVCMDAATGLVRGVRTIRQHATATTPRKELLTVLTHDRGDVTGEKYFGGETAAGADTCNGSGTPAYQLEHSYAYGTRRRSRFTTADTVFYTLDTDVEPNTDLVKTARDEAGVAKTFTYDAVGRLASVTEPAGGSRSVYTYDLTVRPARVIARVFDATATDDSKPLTESYFYYDGFGRLVVQKTREPNGWATTSTKFDLFGRIASESLPVFTADSSSAVPAAAPVVRYAWDMLDRRTEQSFPDGSVVSTLYGSRTIDHETKKAGVVAAKVKQTFDGFDRLQSVTEYLDASASPATTHYKYNHRDQLTGVIAAIDNDPNNPSTAVQQRTLTYDLAGLLVHEDHPESEPASYEYDALRNITRKKVTSTQAGFNVDLTYAYDGAGRPKEVRDSLGVLKEWKYGSVSGMPGFARLETQIRHNRDGALDRVVTDQFDYDAVGRVSKKTTTIAEVDNDPATPDSAVTLTQNFQYTPLSHPAFIEYPTCSNCGGIGAQGRSIALEYEDGRVLHVAGVTATLPTGAFPRRNPAPSVPQGIAYTAAGQVHAVQHATAAGGAGVLDRYEPDPSGMPRVGAITFSGAPDCTPILTQPVNTTIAAGQAAQFQIAVAAGATVQWFQGKRSDTSKLLGSGTTLTTAPLNATTSFWARVKSPAGDCSEDSATVEATVCAPPVLVSPTQDHTVYALSVTSAPIPLSVNVSGSSLRYKWYRTGSPDPILLSETESAVFQPVAADLGKEVEIWVEVTGGCVATTVRWTIRKYRITDQCKAAFTLELPPIVKVLPNESVRLEAAIGHVSDPVSYEFAWYRDGAPVFRQSVPKADAMDGNKLVSSVFTYSVVSNSVIAVEAWVNCAVRDPNNPATIIGHEPSNRVRGETFGLLYGECPVPAVTVDQTAVVYRPDQTSVRMVADSPWPDVTFQWYRGESGNTRAPLAGATSATLTIPAAPDTYWVRITTECGSTADSATIAVSSESCQPVRLRQEPPSVTIAAGESRELFVDASSNYPLTYKWYANGTAIPDATSAAIVVRPLVTTQYHVEVSNRAAGGCHTAVSRAATVHVQSCRDITVTRQPADAFVDWKQSARLEIAATAPAPLRYQWYRGRSGDVSSPISGATAASYSVAPDFTGTYWVRVFFDEPGRCAVDSRTVTVNVCRKPERGADPVPQTSTAPGQQRTLWVVATGQNLSYRWYEGTATGPNLSKRLGSVLDMIRVNPVVTTLYWARVISDCAGTDNDAYLDIGPIEVSVCPEIVQNPQPATVVANTSAVLSVQANRGDRFQWYAGASGDTSRPQANGDKATFTTPPVTGPASYWVRVYSGSCFRNSSAAAVTLCPEPHVTWFAGIDKQIAPGEGTTLRVSVTPESGVTKTFYEGNSGDVANSKVLRGPTGDTLLPVVPPATTRYWVRAQMTGGNCYADTPTLTVEVCEPAITAQPQSVMIDKVSNPSATATLTVGAAGPSLTYQWYEGNSGDTARPVPGGNAASVAVSPSAQTSYWVRVTAACGSRDSAAAVVSLCEPAKITIPPTSRVVDSGATHTFEVTATGTNVSYQWYSGPTGYTARPVCTNSRTCTVGPVTVTVDYWVRVTGACGPPADSATVRLSVAPSNLSVTPASAMVTSGTSARFTVSASGTALSYQWYAGAGTGTPATGATARSATFDTPPLTGNATYSYWCRVNSGSAYADTGMVTAAVCQPRAITVENETQFAGYAVTLSVSGGARTNETYEWYEGTTGNTARRIGTGPAEMVRPTESTRYWLRTIYPTCQADTADVLVRVCYPTITAQPQGGTVNPSPSVTLSVAAIGPAPLTYQWYRGASGDTSAPEPGATAASLTVAPADTTSYWVRVQSAAGCAVNSNAATVTVCKSPAITAQPVSRSVPAGTHDVSVTATGTNLSYQWYIGDSGVTSAPTCGNSPVCTVTVSATTKFWVRVSGSCGAAVNSAAAMLSLAPAIQTQPADVSICSNQPVTFSVAASGTFLQYQWYRGTAYDASRPIDNATGSSVTIAPAATESVWCLVRSGDSTTATRTATATVQAGPAALNPLKEPYACGYKLTARISAAETGSVQYQWFEGPLGDTSRPVSINRVYTACPASLPATYWVRISYTSGGGCWTDRVVTLP